MQLDGQGEQNKLLGRNTHRASAESLQNSLTRDTDPKLAFSRSFHNSVAAERIMSYLDDKDNTPQALLL